MSAFHEGLAEIFEVAVADMTPNFRLEDANWDSLAIVSTIALIDDLYDRTVSADALAACTTVADLDALVARECAVRAA
ncbi:acyl carrier protein [Methylobacterium brachiatum]|jgi:acyl carrier protein|uniref:Acyl carrier protein n=1 Tax=Methylobacterium brachiatum TaxID=269660 RepID=A0AAJ1WXE3_9HYPH|nr:acyl carrier protein [Methylobacterium brachiatum]MCB4804315.1 acyl carrier protein [Methylobacterium brachiatum]MDQ0545337.1 acyl carrier protein [Methylobacterium brachiatum]